MAIGGAAVDGPRLLRARGPAGGPGPRLGRATDRSLRSRGRRDVRGGRRARSPLDRHPKGVPGGRSTGLRADPGAVRAVRDRPASPARPHRRGRGQQRRLLRSLPRGARPEPARPAPLDRPPGVPTGRPSRRRRVDGRDPARSSERMGGAAPPPRSMGPPDRPFAVLAPAARPGTAVDRPVPPR
jgi:hypothetical protein